jgi:hypothetical protein
VCVRVYTIMVNRLISDLISRGQLGGGVLTAMSFIIIVFLSVPFIIIAVIMMDSAP